MQSIAAPHLAAMKDALLSLKPAGADGFEGLLAAVLSDVCSQPFRLAASGSQRGRDGNSAFDEGATYFEAKLYRNGVDPDAVSTKLVELELDDEGQVDTWALCATSAVSTQLAERCTKSLAKNGIGCLILDWPEHTLPPLAAVLALAPDIVEEFVLAKSTDPSRTVGLREHLDAIVADGQFADLAVITRKALTEATVGFGLAKAANRKSLIDTFSDRREARRVFGQPLSPLDSTGFRSVDRPLLLDQLTAAFVGSPADRVFVVIGEEGTGKSWLVANAWVGSSPSPLLAVFTADELIQTPLAQYDFEGTLIVKLASIGDGDTPSSRKRWKRRFGRWRSNPNPDDPRVVVFVDGLNQVPDFAWARWIDTAAKSLESLGGSLVITTTERHFALRLRNEVTTRVCRVIVGEWSEEELRAILTSRNISADGLSSDVTRFLRNPRILGIAVELLDARDIERFDELTVGRLLFEHIRRSERNRTVDVPVDEFVATLRDHADEIIARYSAQQRDDLKIFSIQLNDRLQAVANSRFFEAVAGEPRLYSIKDDGLPLALGLSLVRSLRQEERNGRDPAAKLAVILEPILALAETSEVVFSALEAASLDDQCPTVVTAALIQHLVTLQNLSEDRWPAFASLVKYAPGAFVAAARAVALSPDRQPHLRWLTAALLAARGNPKVLAAIKAQVGEWLSYYSLAPERQMITQRRHDGLAKYEAEKAKREQELAQRQSGLSNHEQDFIASRLIRMDEGNLSGLQLLALQLLGGLKLSDLAPALVNFAFSSNLNGGFTSPDEQFAQLTFLNTVDWSETRDALLQSAEPLLRAETSPTGQWAAVGVLRATGSSDDAAQAEEIYKELTKDRTKLGSWRLIENYCSVDPCDPQTSLPPNISETASRYAGLDVTTLRSGPGYSMEDHFFDDARPGLARFDPQTVIEVTRKFARSVKERAPGSQRRAVYSLLGHSALLDTEMIDWLVENAVKSPGSLNGSSDEQDAWIASQYGLFAALAHMSGNQQLAIFVKMPGHSMLLHLLQSLVPADEAAVEQALERALKNGEADALARVTSFVYYSRSPLSSRAREIIGLLFNSPDKLVRALAFGVAARSRDKTLLTEIASSNWNGAVLDRKLNFFERWHGSAALIAAAEIGVADPADILDRVAPNFYADIVALPQPAKELAFSRINTAVARASTINAVPGIPLIEQSIPSSAPSAPPSRSIVDDASSLDAQAFFERMNETNEGFRARQRRAWNAVDQFAKDVEIAEAAIIVDDFSWKGFDTLVLADPNVAKSWLAKLLTMQSSRLRQLQYFALGIARSLAREEPKDAAALLRRLSEEKPIIRRIGDGGIPAEAEATWIHADVADIKVVCFERLDFAATDADIAAEVNAAYRVGRSIQVNEYIDLKLASGLPSGISRGLMVAGFSDADNHAESTLKRFSDDKGFVGSAQRAALYAYDRNLWARHWYEQMRCARTLEDFWRNAVLLTKIVDARFSLWRDQSAEPGSIFERFFPTIDGAIQSRMKGWTDKRKIKLFGQDVPDPAFLKLA